MKLLSIIKKSPAGKLLIAVPVIILVVVLFLALRKDKVDNSVKLQQGIAYLEALEAKNPQDMMDELREKQREEESAKVDEILAKIDSGEISIWSQFNGAAILGDSRAEDFVFDGFLTTTNVFAEKGTMCTDAMDYLDAVASANPARIFFTYGMNDVDGYWNTAADYIEGYTKVIKAYREKIPGAVIFVNSIIPVNAHAIENDSNYKNIPEYNEAMKKMADDLGVCWIDCDSYLDDYPELYDTDGQHFFPEMYPIWARTMLKAAFDYEYAQTGDADALSRQVSANADAAQAAAAESADNNADTAGENTGTSDGNGETSGEENADEAEAGNEDEAEAGNADEAETGNTDEAEAEDTAEGGED